MTGPTSRGGWSYASSKAIAGLLALPHRRDHGSTLAERVLEKTGLEAQIVTVPYQEELEGMQRRVPDIERVEAALGWTPIRRLDDILTDVIAFEKTKMAA